MKITILHTNDIHSRFESFAKISTKIKQLRDETTLVLDAGDFNDFMRIELQGTKGRAGSELLKLAGYDAIAVGNNEGFEGIDIIESLATMKGPAFLSCNLYKKIIDANGKDSHVLQELEGVKRSIIIKRGDTRFLIIGTSPYGTYNEFYNLLDMHSTNAIDEINKEIESNKDKYDICILLSHCGMREDTEIANSIKEIDIIINGHSHILMDQVECINNKLIHMSGKYGEHLGVLEVEYNDGIRLLRGENIEISEVAADPSIIESLERSKEKAIVSLSKPLFSINNDLWHDIVEENPITNFLADSLRDLLETDLAIINSGVLNGGIRKGKVSLKKLIEICPSPLNPTYMEIEGKYIREAFEKALEVDFCMQDGRGSGFRGKYLGRLHISGGYIEYSDRTIRKIVIGSSDLEDERWYKVATSDYLQRGSGYYSLSNNRNIKYNVEYLRDLLREQLTNESILKDCLIDRWICKE